ncbi:helicase-exonuclease AddAB subunit AddA [Clostridium fermenticellae]|uniref:ATP-dependent helicase/nuclease subunit A n=1 Tax=Clostridium fermenticellae TaxID=2068654 RepID=A0A386H5S2_9CLOT|nr:helicase-exonuclease AddAB subunit AddA [Clostridium fermenticellae]AYD41059.1 helicase-exonuclease AddAB subunit AddA [Clostridium fermenticellae]
MSTNWTYEQKQAIYTKNCNLLVAAGAGAGKTAVLVKRIIEKITDSDNGIDIDKLLVVTFTNAAASEMKERIGDAISKELEEKPESKNLQKQLILLNKANIMTIHSFCLKIIRENFHVVDLDPNFRVCDDTEAVLLKQEALDDVMEDMYDSDDPELLKLLECYGRKNDFNVQNLILDLHRFSTSNPYPKKWLVEMAEEFNVDPNFDFGKSKWAEMLVKYVNVEITACLHNLEKALTIVKNASGISYYIDPLEHDIYNMKLILSCENWDSMNSVFKTVNFDKLPAKKNKDADKEAKEKAKGIRDNVKKKVLAIISDIFVENKNISKDIKHVYFVLKSLVDVVIAFDDRFSIKKRERGVIDFNDIEHFCLEILTETHDNKILPSKVALGYRDDFDEILIDEYQDSNEVQEVIMNSISKKDPFPNMFMVGDVKQSIYKFRKAKPELFLHKYNTYSEEKNSLNRKIKLFKNFRSRKEIIDGVNYVFNQIMSRRVGEIDYDESEFLECAASFEKTDNDMPIELDLIDKSESKNDADLIIDDGDEENPDNIQIEARLVAKKINELVNGDSSFLIYDKTIDAYRKVEYRDIVILLRATSNWASVYVQELMEKGIPVFADTAIGYFDSSEIKTIMCMLKIVDNPMQDIPLLAVLRSPIESFEPEELIDIRMVNKDINFYSAMKLIDQYFEDDACEEDKIVDYTLDHISLKLKNKVSAFLNRLDVWRDKSMNMDLNNFIWYLYTDTGYYGFVGAMPGGSQRQANLRMLFDKAVQYENTSYKGLFNFINFIDKVKNSSGDMGSAKILGENENVVKIMSIHKSKGLEFPIVILSGTGKNFNLMDANKSILFHSDLGFGADFIDAERRISYPTLQKQIIKRKIKLETLSEEMRILYVALTRAKEKLILTGMVNNIEKTCHRWCECTEVKEEKIPEYYTISARSYLDWIGGALSRHKDGKLIRRLGQINVSKYVIEDNSKWTINLYDKSIFRKKIYDDSENDVLKYINDINLDSNISEFGDEVSRRLNWKYKYRDAQNISAKMSISELKRKFLLSQDGDSEVIFKNTSLNTPKFLKETKNISGAERGTIVHLVLQKLDLKNVLRSQDIAHQIEGLITKNFITQEEAKCVDVQKILRLFTSKLGKRMLNSNNVYREKQFIINLSSSEIYEDLPKKLYEDEKILVQGIIDCYFEEDDELVVIDYKTDYIEDIGDIKRKYEFQLKYYAKALELITGKKVKNKYLYLLYNNTAVEI